MFFSNAKEDRQTYLMFTGLGLVATAYAVWQLLTQDFANHAAFAVGDVSLLILALGCTLCFGLPLLVYRTPILRHGAFALCAVGTLFATSTLTERLSPALVALNDSASHLSFCGTTRGTNRHGGITPDALFARAPGLCTDLNDLLESGLDGDDAVRRLNQSRA